jgi:hypothetical protein
MRSRGLVIGGVFVAAVGAAGVAGGIAMVTARDETNCWMCSYENDMRRFYGGLIIGMGGAMVAGGGVMIVLGARSKRTWTVGLRHDSVAVLGSF